MRERNLIALSLALVAGALVCLLDPTSVFSFAAAYLLVAIVIYWLRADVPGHLVANCVTAAHCAALVLFAVQFTELPAYIGFSGGLGIGTDDHFFYTTGVVDLDGWFIARSNYLNSPYEYSTLLRSILSAYFEVFGHNHPLQVILLNAAALALIPLFANVLLTRLNFPSSVVTVGTMLCLFGPYIVANSAILVRDGWVTAVSIGALAGTFERRWLLVFGLLCIGWVMRLESAILVFANLVLVGMVYANSSCIGGQYRLQVKPIRLGAFAALGAVAGAMLIVGGSALIEASTKIALGRPEFVADFIRRQAMTEGGTSSLLFISQQPIPIRQLLGFIFFLGAPFIALDNIMVGSVFVIRALLANLSALLFVVLLPFFIKALMSKPLWRQSATAALMLVFLIDTLVLAEFSMQIRHKTATLPLFYVIAAMGMIEGRRSALRLGAFAGMGALGINLAVTAINSL